MVNFMTVEFNFTDNYVIVRYQGRVYRFSRRVWEEFREFARQKKFSPRTAIRVALGDTGNLSQDSIGRYYRFIRQYIRFSKEVKRSKLGDILKPSIVHYARFLPIYIPVVGVLWSTANSIGFNVDYVSIISNRRFRNWNRFIRLFSGIAIIRNTERENFMFCGLMVKRQSRVRNSLDQNIRRTLTEIFDKVTQKGSSSMWICYGVMAVRLSYEEVGVIYEIIYETTCNTFDEVLQYTFDECLRLAINQENASRELNVQQHDYVMDCLESLYEAKKDYNLSNKYCLNVVVKGVRELIDNRIISRRKGIEIITKAEKIFST